MKKLELIDQVSEDSGYAKGVVRDVLTSTDRVVRQTISDGTPVRLFGLGKLSVIRRPQRVASNFGNDPVIVEASNGIHFRPSTGLRAAANGQ